MNRVVCRTEDDEVRLRGPRVLRDGFVERILPSGFSARVESARGERSSERLDGGTPLGDDASPQRLIDHCVAEVAVEHRFVDEVENHEPRARSRTEHRALHRWLTMDVGISRRSLEQRS